MRERFSPRPCFRQGFSLVELLLVVAVIAVLLSMVLFAAGSLGTGRKLTTAGNLAVDLINHARQVAKARNTLTLLAVLESGDEAGRVLGTMVFSSAGGTTGTWTMLDSWRTLPDGIQVDLGSSTNFLGAVPSNVSPITRGGQSVDCSALVFLPDGRPVSSSTSPLVLFLKPETSSGPAPSLPNYYKIIVNPATGIPFIRRP
jgi:prepilin-type N-terminal cleavage/methylation domain-containing protein